MSPTLLSGRSSQSSANQAISPFGDHPPRSIAYRDTEHYQVTKAFLEHADRMLRELFREDDGAGSAD